MVCHVERETFPASTLVARMEDQVMDSAPVWDDITTFDGLPWRGIVDVITAGLPCQPYSLAGDRKGHDDERALWPEFIRIVEEVEPAIIFLENVAPYLRFYGPVWAELFRLGFIHSPPLLYTAHEGGSIQERRRLFILATHSDRIGRDQGQQGLQAREPVITGRCALSAGPNSSRLERHSYEGRPTPTTRSGEQAASTTRNGLSLEWSGWLFNQERQTLRHDTDRCGDGCRICGSIWETESPIVRVDHGPTNRLVELRAVGNGVVPAVAAAAWIELMATVARHPTP